MLLRIIWIMSCFLIGQTGLVSQEILELEGAIHIGNSEAAFPDPGTIQWTGSDFQVYNGYMWVSLTSGVAYTGEVTDIDGNVYPTIMIGDQEWMAENLRTSKYRDATSIPQVTDNTAWANLLTGAWCWFGNNDGYDRPYGKLYNWYAVNDPKGLCPAGWHVPSNTEWSTLNDFLGGFSVAGGHMKEAGTTHWLSPNAGATNASGFTGLPGGGRDNLFHGLGDLGFWWSSTQETTSQARYRRLNNLNSFAENPFNDKWQGLSVRCVKDDP